ncbi:MAG: TonB-dependent receptor [Bacteroidales bacterium]|nr:TonB-dependent receptor [Bacteroidales bacterium]
MGLAAVLATPVIPAQAAGSETAVSAQQNTKKVKGRVVDASGEPIPGANVLVKGTKTGAMTDSEGYFSIEAATGATLRVSCIGFSTTELRAKDDMTVTLDEDAKLMNEVVSVGYGSMRRKDVTSAITTVQAKDLNKGVFTDPAQMLQGKVPGLMVTSSGDPNGTPSITLRGASSLRADGMSPYYVIDGIPGVDISMVAPDDIESIDVLRDATATAIYGSKAANGVIIINTKKGKAGRTNVTYNGYVGFDVISKTLDMMDASDYRKLIEMTGRTVNDHGATTDWQDEVLRTGVSHNHNVSINGGHNKTSYMASVNYMNRQGVVKGSDMSRLNVRTLISTSVLKDHLDLSLVGNINYGKFEGVAMNNEGQSVMDAMNYYNPTNPIYNADGSWYNLDTSKKSYNPLSMINEDTQANTWRRQQFNAKATLHIIKGLDWNANYSFNNSQRTSSNYHSRASQIYEGRNGQAYRGTYSGTANTFETYGNYDHTWNNAHKLGVMLGYSWEERVNGDGFGATVYNFFDDYVKWNNLSYASSINGINGIESGVKEKVRNISFYGRVNYSWMSRYMLQATLRRDGSSVFGENHRWGTFPSVSAAWNITQEDFLKDNDVLSNLKLRLGYGVSGNAAGFGAYTPVATYGAVGSFTYTNADGTTTDYRTLAATKNANKDLKWESTGMFNVGIDYAFLGGRINGSIEFYNKKTWDLIWEYPVSTNIYPFGKINANVGEMTNRGIEISVNADVIDNRAKKFRWNTGLSLTHNKNRVDKLSNDIYKTDIWGQGDPMVAGVSSNGWTQRVIEGEALGTFSTFQFAGFDAAGHATYYTRDENGNLDGGTTTSPETKDRTITGSAQPKLLLGWNNTFTWKNWSATLFFNGVFGNKIYNGTRANYMGTAQFEDGKNVLKDVMTEQTMAAPAGTASSTGIILCSGANVPSDRWIENGSYLRLQTFTLSYTFDKGFKNWIKDLSLYFTANNVFTITAYKGLDPEVNMGGIDPGIDYRWSTYPHTRTFMIGAKINF